MEGEWKILQERIDSGLEGEWTAPPKRVDSGSEDEWTILQERIDSGSKVVGSLTERSDRGSTKVRLDRACGCGLGE